MIECATEFWTSYVFMAIVVILKIYRRSEILSSILVLYIEEDTKRYKINSLSAIIYEKLSLCKILYLSFISLFKDHEFSKFKGTNLSWCLEYY